MLRYRVGAGRAERRAVELIAELDAVPPRAATSRRSHPVGLELQVGPALEADDGGLTYPLRIHSAVIEEGGELDPPTERRLRELLEPLTRITGIVTTSERGLLQASRFDIPSDASPQTRALLANIHAAVARIPLPRQEVGVGARWRVTRTADLPLVQRAEQMFTYTLTELEGEHGRALIAMRQSAPPQRIPGPTAEPSDTVQSYETTGRGDAVLHLGHLIPPVAALEVVTRAQLTLEEQPRSGPVELRVNARLNVSQSSSD